MNEIEKIPFYERPEYDPTKDTTLENWYVDSEDMIIGAVYNHPRRRDLYDGAVIKTSRVVTWDKVTGKVRTLNTNYVLGKPLDKDRFLVKK